MSESFLKTCKGVRLCRLVLMLLLLVPLSAVAQEVKITGTVTDANTPYRLMNADTLKRYIDLVPENFNLSNVLLSVIFAKKGCRVKFIPITFRPRQGGVNSINLKRIFKIGRQALKDFKTINKQIKDIDKK